MQVLIEIPDEEYKKISNSNPSYADDFSIYYAIRNGKPLPKGHGRLIDEKIIIGMVDKDSNWVYDLTDMPEYIAGLPAIIQAESEE